MLRSALRACAAFILAGILIFSASAAIAQTSSTVLRGVVKDPSGAVIPNVTLTLKDTATGLEKTAQSGDDGSYTFPNLVNGTYELTAKANGFDKAVIGGVTILTGRTTDLPVSMKVGNINTTVEVTASGVQLEITSNTVSTTIQNNSIQELPMAGRDTLNFALLMPGAQSVGSDRNSTFDGLPNASMNITIDGTNNNSQRFKSGGTSFFGFAPARLDAMEEVTVSTTGQGAEAAGQGAMSIQFVTKRGTDQYHFRLLEQFHNEALQANSYMNGLRGIARTKTRQNYAMGSIGGPLVPFVPYLKDKLFFFAYFEANPQPGSGTQSSTMLQHEVGAGNYTFITTGGATKTLNVFDVAKQYGYNTAVDPTVTAMLNRIWATEQAPEVTGYLANQSYPFQRTMLWNYGYYSRHFYPTARVDYQINPNISYHGTWNYRSSRYNGTPPYPGEDAAQYNWAGNNNTDTWVISNTVDWTVTPKMVNSFTFGNQMNWEYFSTGFDIHQWSAYGDRIVNLPFGSAFVPNSTSDNRNNPVWELKDNLSWMKGRHSIKIGGSFLKTTMWSLYHGNDSGVLQYGFGVRSDDPIYNNMYNAMKNAGASTNTSDIGNFLSIYAMLTGRISSIGGTANVNPDTEKFEKFNPQWTNFGFTTVGLYAQDSFRWTPRFTLNYGLRWQLDGSVHGTIPIYATINEGGLFGPSLGNFQPGVLGGNMNPAFVKNSNPYKADLVNPAPNLGFAWNPQFEKGILRRLFGNDKTVVRGSFGMTFYNEGLNAISNYLPSNPGSTQSISGAANVNFTPGSQLLSMPDPTLSVNPASFNFPIPLSQFMLNGGRSINAFNPDLKSPYTSSWMFGLQRELAKGLLLDVRYVGNKSTHMWHLQSLQEINIFENGFLQEFNNARSNLAINQAAGVQSFANRGLAGQVALPFFETILGANGTQPAISTGSGFGNSSWIQTISYGSAGSFANTLASTSAPTYFCRMVGGNFAPCAALGYTTPTKYPINYFKANPFASSLNYQDSNSDNNYNGLQVQLTRSLSHGLMGSVSYTWSHTMGTQGNVANQAAEVTYTTLRDAKLSYYDTAYDHRHSITGYWTYDLPMGNGRFLNISNKVLDRVLSNWTVGGIHKFISGGPVYLTGGRATFNQWADGGIIFGNGLTLQSLADRLDTIVGGYDSACQCFHTDVSDLQMANKAVDPKFYRPGDTPGVIGFNNMYRGKWNFQFDMSLNKEVRITERVKMGLKATATNVLNHPWRTGRGSTSITGTGFGQVTSFAAPRVVQLRAYIDF
jgi:hypothetical protein